MKAWFARPWTALSRPCLAVALITMLLNGNSTKKHLTTNNNKSHISVKCDAPREAEAPCPSFWKGFEYQQKSLRWNLLKFLVARSKMAQPHANY